MWKINFRQRLLFRASWYWVFVETIMVTLVILAIAYYVNPEDPLLLDATFPWIWFAPVLVALRYGTLAGAGSIVIIFIALFYFEPRIILETAQYRIYMLGGVLLMVVCGEFYNAWLASKRRYAQLNEYIRKRLDGLNRAFYLMRLSHDRLEQSLISRPVTLRSAIGELRQLLAQEEGEFKPDIASRFLHILEQYCSLSQAAIYLVKNNKPETTSLAHIGKQEELVMNDPLVQESIQHSGVHYFGVNRLDDKQKSHYLATISFRDLEDKLLGLLVIHDMPFWSLNEEVLQSLAILVSYMAESIWSTSKAKATIKAYPTCPPQFAIELNNLLQLKKILAVESALIAFVIPRSDRSENIALGVQHRQRGLDVGWKLIDKARDVLFVLMPFSGPSAVEGFRNRFALYLKQEFGIELGGEEVYLRYLQLAVDTGSEAIQQLMEYVDDK